METGTFRSRKSQRLRASEASGHGVPDHEKVGVPTSLSRLCEDGFINTGAWLGPSPLGQSSQALRCNEARLFSLSSFSDVQWILGANDSQTLGFCELSGVGRDSLLFSP